MCLLVVLHHAHPDGPLIIAANRDEQLTRPSAPMMVLEAGPPRILGGRDELALGTWMAANEAGVVAALTNVPSLEQQEGKRSRGELPLALAAHERASEAVADFIPRFSPADFRSAWLLVGDREELHYLDMTGGPGPRATPLAPGIHVLENRPLGAASPKVEYVRRLLLGVEEKRGAELISFLGDVLGNHEIPGGAGRDSRPEQTEAACVHAGSYGTRSSSIIVVPASAEDKPRVWYADGPPCTTPFVDRSDLWQDS